MVAHSMSVIAVQAGVGAHVHRRAAREARAVARGDLGDFAARRSPRCAGCWACCATSDGARSTRRRPASPTSPSSSTTCRSVGVTGRRSHRRRPVRLHRSGLELSAYRMVQEGAHQRDQARRSRHAPPSPCSAARGAHHRGQGRRSWRGVDHVRPTASLRATGHGLIGMRERVDAVGRRAGRRARVRWRIPGRAPSSPTVTRRDDAASSSPTTRRSCAAAFVVLLDRRDRTSRSWARPPTGPKRSSCAASEQPDVMLMDIRMPEMDGLEATRRISGDAAPAATRVLILTTFDLDEYVYEALRAGASGFLLKDTLPGGPARRRAGGRRRRCPDRSDDHPTTDRGVRPLPEPGAATARCRARAADRPRAGSARARRQGPVERRDRAPASS